MDRGIGRALRKRAPHVGEAPGVRSADNRIDRYRRNDQLDRQRRQSLAKPHSLTREDVPNLPSIQSCVSNDRISGNGSPDPAGRLDQPLIENADISRLRVLRGDEVTVSRWQRTGGYAEGSLRWIVRCEDILL